MRRPLPDIPQEPQKNARERLMESAQALYCLFPVAYVGVEAILSEAGVAKATLYKFYGSKEGLTRAVMERASGRMLAEFADLGRQGAQDGTSGFILIGRRLENWLQPSNLSNCLYLRLASQANGSDANALVRAHAQSMRAILEDWGRSVNARDPEKLAQSVLTVMDGATTGFLRDRDLSIAQTADAMIAVLLEGQVPNSGTMA